MLAPYSFLRSMISGSKNCTVNCSTPQEAEQKQASLSETDKTNTPDSVEKEPLEHGYGEPLHHFDKQPNVVEEGHQVSEMFWLPKCSSQLRRAPSHSSHSSFIHLHFDYLLLHLSSSFYS
ncbi:unnamed protein product [Haemonchus placei]|uniref:Ovule protein n=1 Tax=Haemonchus placei TaxID=6290 RepID=A0A0N4VXF5_HAEPC|nr:unnamed protein product [Haemonchus placei]